VSQTWFTGSVSEHWHADAFRLFSRYVCGFVFPSSYCSICYCCVL
jgi:hypothetical protein